MGIQFTVSPISVVVWDGLLNLVWDGVGLGWCSIAYYNHIGILPNIPDQTKETRLRDS